MMYNTLYLAIVILVTVQVMYKIPDFAVIFSGIEAVRR